ncbi:nucleolar complex-associated protein-domain-containing protein [Mycena floridula]|nr:nucleolar complex-associated protein-domain-containing protein [Mycena floridula]
MPAKSTGKKRTLPQSERPAKRRKAVKAKDKAADRGHIPIPVDDEDVELSDQDLEVLETYSTGTAFLQRLDRQGISRSKKETLRLHQLNKPTRFHNAADDELPAVESHSEDDEPWDSDVDDISLDSDDEMPYEKAPRKRQVSWDEENNPGVQRLPIKLANGRIKDTGRNQAPVLLTEESSSESEMGEPAQNPAKKEDVATAARFGRRAVVDIIGTSSRKARIHAAKDQIASICQDIVADPENSLGLLRRLHSFSLPQISTPSHPDPVVNDPIIRKLAFLSQLAVFKDIIPGYSIRALTDKEKTEKVSQMVSRTRDWEQGLVVVYQSYLRLLEGELKTTTELTETSIQCICTLLTEVTHFNFRVNLMSCVVARLSKRSWDKSSELCLKTLIAVFRADVTGAASLEIVRLLNRMIKEKHFNVRPQVLGCLYHLRLKTELGTRASQSKADKEMPVKLKGKDAKRQKANQPHLSKNARKIQKEQKEIQREFREAEAEVDKEERETTHTETLKLLFVLYFRILKNPTPTALLPAALEGISRYAHLVNIDFFRDLIAVLKGLVALETYQVENDDEEIELVSAQSTKLRLRCIVTAFELLSGQGESLNIDLSDFITHLYAMIPSLGLLPEIETPSDNQKNDTLADLLFRVLNIVFSARASGPSSPTWRSAAFAKRLLSVSLHWPSNTALRALEFVRVLLSKDFKLRALLSTEDRTFDGVYRPDVDDPQLCNPLGTSLWELYALQDKHWDRRVREEAEKLINSTYS